MSSKRIYAVKDRIARIAISRPEVMSAMDPAVDAAISKAWGDVRDNPAAWVAIVSGAGGKGFTAGADRKRRRRRPPIGRTDFWLTPKDMRLDCDLQDRKPIIAAVSGIGSAQ